MVKTKSRPVTEDTAVYAALQWLAANLRPTSTGNAYGMTFGAVAAPEVVFRTSTSRDIRNRVRQRILAVLAKEMPLPVANAKTMSWQNLRDKLTAQELQLGYADIYGVVQRAIEIARP